MEQARDEDAKESWEHIEQREAQAIGKGRCRVEAALKSPNGKVPGGFKRGQNFAWIQKTAPGISVRL
jgi:hypothetical protein